MIKHYIKNSLLFLFSNILVATSFLFEFYLSLLMIISMSDDTFFCCAVFLFVTLIFIGKFTILPVVYDFILKSSRCVPSIKIICKIKKSSLIKIIVLLILTLFPVFFNKIRLINIFTHIIFSLLFGILGSYIFLFLYWYIKDKFKENHFIQKLLNIMINKYTCISSVIAILLGYIAIAIMVFTSNFNKI